MTAATIPDSAVPVRPRAVWPVATFGTMLALIALLTIQLLSVSAHEPTAATASADAPIAAPERMASLPQ